MMSSSIIALVKRRPTPTLNSVPLQQTFTWPAGERWGPQTPMAPPIVFKQVVLIAQKGVDDNQTVTTVTTQGHKLNRRLASPGCCWRQEISEWICFSSISKRGPGASKNFHQIISSCRCQQKKKKQQHNIVFFFLGFLKVFILKGNALTLNRLLGRTSWWCKWGPRLWNYPSHGAFQKAPEKNPGNSLRWHHFDL